MIFEVRKAGFVNKGAHLMLLAVVQQIRARYPGATLVMSPSVNSGSQPFDSLVAAGFRPKASMMRRGIQFGDLAALVPDRVREMYGLVLDREVDVVLDAAGFAYGAPWHPGTLAELAHSARRWRQRDTGLILLPQAFGELSSDAFRSNAKKVARDANLIFARDPHSLECLHQALAPASLAEEPKVSSSPDFTALLPGTPPEEPDFWRTRIAVVPNARMLDQTTPDIRAAYLPFLRRCMTEIHRRGGLMAVIAHEGAEDLPLARELAANHPGCAVVAEADPLRLKGLLGACRGVIASRFHALVNALGQGVPAFGTGWSHKYPALFAGYGVAEGLLDPRSSADPATAAARLLDDAWCAKTRERLCHHGEQQRQQIAQMWARVFAVCDEVLSRRQSFSEHTPRRSP